MMRKLLPAALAAVIAGGASWALAEEQPADPEVTETPSTTVVEETTTTTVVDPTTTTTVPPDEDPVEPDEGEGDEAEGDDGGNGREGHPENHGRYVSEAAHDHDHPGQSHGEFVSDVAHSDAGRG